MAFWGEKGEETKRLFGRGKWSEKGENLTSKHVPKHQSLEEGRIAPPRDLGSVTPKSPECQRSSPC